MKTLVRKFFGLTGILRVATAACAQNFALDWFTLDSGSIQPGDLLTTSDTPGHAMRVVDSARAQGAILGKAMSGLKEGQGTVLVLATLQ